MHNPFKLTSITALALSAAFSASAQANAPDIAVRFTGPTELELGRPDRFTLTLSNPGYAAATTTSATMVFPPGVELDTRINTATGRPEPKVPTNCSYTASPVKRLTCMANNVAVGGSDVRTFTIDLRAPTSGATVGNFSWTASTPGDNNSSNDVATLATTFANFAPAVGLNFPATLSLWVTMGRKNLLDGNLTRPSAVLPVDATGNGVNGTTSWTAAKVGNNLSMTIRSATYNPSVVMNSLTPLNSRCFQGMGYWASTRDSYEVRLCY